MELSAAGLDLIKHFEGLRLEAYPDPGTGGDPWTIGFGTTRGVTPGMVITEEEAEIMLYQDLQVYVAGVNRLMSSVQLAQLEFDALVSFAYNCGVSALEGSTLRTRLLAGEPRCWVYQKELLRWNKGGTGVLEGLTRRRQAEADMACKGYLTQAPAAIEEAEQKLQFPLDVPYFWQRDSETGHGERMCFSSSMAMAMDYIDPEAFEGDDDWYLQHVFKYGDTVSSAAQVQAAESLGYRLEFRTDGTEEALIEQLNKGIPIPVGILHRGSIDSPSGGGHWICLVGVDDTYFHVHDPFGELSLVAGGYPKAGPEDGKFQKYTRKNLMKRWLIDGSGQDGWYMKFL